mgnify:CR=1 FL=1
MMSLFMGRLRPIVFLLIMLWLRSLKCVCDIVVLREKPSNSSHTDEVVINIEPHEWHVIYIEPCESMFKCGLAIWIGNG